VAMVFELRAETGEPRGTLARVGERLGVNPETLRNWVEKAEVDSGQRPGTTSDDRKRIAELEREVRELRRANVPEGGERLFRSGTRPPTSALVEFIDSHKDRFGVEPACAVLEIAASTSYAAKKREENPPARDARDEELKRKIMRVWKEKGRGGYGARKVWRELSREGIEVARCTVERLMRELGIAGAAAKRKRPRTTVPAGPGHERPSDLLERDFTAPAPNRRWVADITYRDIRCI
jgi:HTH-like domain/Transposase